MATRSMYWDWGMDVLNTAEKSVHQVVNTAAQQILRNILAKVGAIST